MQVRQNRKFGWMNQRGLEADIIKCPLIWIEKHKLKIAVYTYSGMYKYDGVAYYFSQEKRKHKFSKKITLMWWLCVK